MTSDEMTTTFTDRRSVPRFSPNPATSCEVSGAGAAVQPGTIQNISSNGIKLSVKDAPAIGASLILTLTNKNSPIVNQALAVRVARVARQADGSFVLGCAFQRQLTGHELLALAL